VSRSGYVEPSDNWQFRIAQAIVSNAIKSDSGQVFLRELRTALEVMPQKQLITGKIENENGEVCAIGAVAKMRGMNDVAKNIDPENRKLVAETFGLPEELAAEIVYLNDEALEDVTTTMRWMFMYSWVVSQIA